MGQNRGDVWLGVNHRTISCSQADMLLAGLLFQNQVPAKRNSNLDQKTIAEATKRIYFPYVLYLSIIER